MKISIAWILGGAMFLATIIAPANAALINLDFSPEPYPNGPAVFGGVGSIWNNPSRGANNVPLLVDDTGAATTVTVTTGRVNSGPSFGAPTGAFANLGIGWVSSDLVTIAGLTPSASYDLAVMFTSQGVTDWSVLTQGVHYTLTTSLMASAGGVLTFIPPGPNIVGNPNFTAFQLRDSAISVSEPATLAILSLGFLGLSRSVRWRK